MRYLWRVKIDGLWYVGAYYKFLPYTFCPFEYMDREGHYKHVLIQTEFSNWNMPSDIITINIPNDCLSTLGQCTGLKDKNGTLIYEGDICEYDFDDIGKQKALIYWHEKDASFYSKPLNDFQFTKLDNCIVVGNKWEETL